MGRSNTLISCRTRGVFRIQTITKKRRGAKGVELAKRYPVMFTHEQLECALTALYHIVTQAHCGYLEAVNSEEQEGFNELIKASALTFDFLLKFAPSHVKIEES